MTALAPASPWRCALGAVEVPRLGIGLGLRPELEPLVLGDTGAVDWLEVIAEHYMGRPAAVDRLLELAGGRRIVPHGIELSIGTETEPDRAYLDDLIGLVQAVDAPWFSDHLCFTRSSEFHLGALTPLPRSQPVARSVARRARAVQEAVGRPFLLENIAYHVRMPGELTEGEFITSVVEEAGCGLLLDLANLFQNAVNHEYDAYQLLDQLPLERVIQVHLAGGTLGADRRYHDTHSEAVPEGVWDLLAHLWARAPVAGVLLERDQNLSRTGEILADLGRARALVEGRS